jgi:hypothetical protein
VCVVCLLKCCCYSGGDIWTGELCDKIKALWADSHVQELYKRPDVIALLNESAPYFFDQLDRFRDPEGYTPTKQDVLRARVRSTGIEEAEFKFDDFKFRMLDVGGQRSERRKWIHCLAVDHQILTNKGFLFMDQMQEADESVLVAAYNALTGEMVYERPLRFVGNPADARRPMVEFGHADNGVSLLVTTGHDMYVTKQQQQQQQVTDCVSCWEYVVNMLS